MFPRTIHNQEAHACISALQKMIRRGLEREAMEFACELSHTSKGFSTWVANRLEFIAHEDVGLAAPEIIPLVRLCCQQAKEWYDAKDMGRWRTPIGTAIRALCRAPKSREGDHFQAAIGLKSELEGYVPSIPDWCWDKHTIKGRKMGRGIDHFRAECAKLSPAPAEKDPYEDEAYRLWKLSETEKAKKKDDDEWQDNGGEKKLF